jgi:hypothetical protein
MESDKSAASSPSDDQVAMYARARIYLLEFRGICSDELDEEKARDQPRAERLEWLTAEITKLRGLSRRLRPDDHELAAQICDVYGPLLRGGGSPE